MSPFFDGAEVDGDFDGLADGLTDGDMLGEAVGLLDGAALGEVVGLVDGDFVGEEDGDFVREELCEVRLGEIKAINIQPSPNYRTAEGEDVNSVNWPKSLALISSSTLTSVIPVTLDSAAF